MLDTILSLMYIEYKSIVHYNGYTEKEYIDQWKKIIEQDKNNYKR